ncbi:glycopeptide resistance-associated protein GraF [Staphylococcus succinus]|nr:MULTISPECIES: glycopeptide resistance-associated protein GraF [Staphylococcus]MBU0437254.1 glycopeptide resistance-associated protein GraF [Staphylococcus succinus]MDH9160960.1 glycopeptide resistance-associated protein GraF [Staphylococcus succinus]MEB7461847.1 glycopeptide resistance-associated protein GraF [Staphylococcus succinus]MEB8124188.1 glycopeptide resistance-associated protein GraF [Staphylococcus succinus]MEB8126186.1 glycopeptide resistance-associated protein GraF [Staphylococ
MSKEELNKEAAEKAKAAEDKLKEQQSSNDGEEETKKNIQDTLD